MAGCVGEEGDFATEYPARGPGGACGEEGGVGVEWGCGAPEGLRGFCISSNTGVTHLYIGHPWQGGLWASMQ